MRESRRSCYAQSKPRFEARGPSEARIDEWVYQGTTLDRTAEAVLALLATMAVATYLLW